MRRRSAGSGLDLELVCVWDTDTDIEVDGRLSVGEELLLFSRSHKLLVSVELLG
jgi:hypothetical protein